MATATQKVKANVLQRFGSRCFYCKDGLTVKTATMDHLVPRSVQRGVPYNLRPACVKCNAAKGNLSLSEFRRLIIRLFFRMALNPFFGGQYAHPHSSR